MWIDHVRKGHEDLAEHYEELVALIKVKVASELRDELHDMQQLIEQSNGVWQSVHDGLTLEGNFLNPWEKVRCFTAFLEPNDERIQDFLFDPGIQISLFL